MHGVSRNTALNPFKIPKALLIALRFCQSFECQAGRLSDMVAIQDLSVHSEACVAALWFVSL